MIVLNSPSWHISECLIWFRKGRETAISFWIGEKAKQLVCFQIAIGENVYQVDIKWNKHTLFSYDCMGNV